MKKLAAVAACIGLLAAPAGAFAAPGSDLNGANNQPGKSDCDCMGHVDDVPGANGLCK